MAGGNIVPHVGGEQAGYLFEFKPEGVFLTVYPTLMSEFELSDMRQILKEYSVEDYSIETLAKTVREASGNPVKIGYSYTLPPDWKPDEETNNNEVVFNTNLNKNYGSVTIDVSRDRLEVKVRFNVTEEQAIPTVAMVNEALQLKNIQYGIDLEAIEEGCDTGRPFVAAKGVAPVNGEDAKLIKKYDLSAKGRPVANEYDQVDYKNLNLCIIAHKGQILAERIPHTKGVPGINVYGDKVPAKNGKPRPMPKGKNTDVQDENFLIAAMDGQIVENGNKIRQIYILLAITSCRNLTHGKKIIRLSLGAFYLKAAVRTFLRHTIFKNHHRSNSFLSLIMRNIKALHQYRWIL